MEDTDERGPNVLLMLAMSLGLWGLLCLGIASVWSRQVDAPTSPAARLSRCRTCRGTPCRSSSV